MHCDGLGADVLDLDARYSVDGYEGIAFYLRGYVERYDPETGEDIGEDRDYVRAVMVGDDREHVIDVSDLTRLADEDYCGVCGQIGCTHDGR